MNAKHREVIGEVVLHGLSVITRTHRYRWVDFIKALKYALEAIDFKGLKIPCDICKQILTKPGAILFGPPRNGICKKIHICSKCFKKIGLNNVSRYSKKTPKRCRIKRAS